MKSINKIKKLLTLAVLILSFFAFSFNSASAEGVFVYLGGDVLGFTLNTKGATIVGFCDVITEKGLVSPCKNAGLTVGDVIYNMGSLEINSASDLTLALKDYDSGEIVTKISRNGEVKLIDLVPVKDLTGEYKLGVYIRDDLTGLGTVTFYNEDGCFASLGHPVSDEKGKLFDVVGGQVYNSTVIGVNKATRGKAGELRGMFIGDKSVGDVKFNSSVGLYGKIHDFNAIEHKKIECGKARQGKAQIYSTVDGLLPKIYDIDIVKTDYFSGSNKNLVIKISDKELLKITGGILQGMSGSPIIQNGKLVGAVTHVFINDSSRGYGITIDKMLNQN